jgi:hypothetical protein
MEQRGRDTAPASWTGRVIAPVALIATALVAFLIIQGTVGDSDGDSEEAGGTSTPTQASGCEAGEPPAANAVKDGYYVVEAGEDLTNVSERTCISVERLEELNPNLDPLSIPVNGCIDLVVDGCKVLAQS